MRPIKVIAITILAVIVLVGISTNCSRNEPEAEQQPTQSEVVEGSEEDIIYTRQNPGPWGDKVEGHVPRISWEKTENRLIVTVYVNHEMNAEKPHYIMWVMLKDGDGNLLGEKDLLSSDERAEVTFELTNVPAKLVAYEKCNLHGVWMEEAVVE